jgi:hypothetical protein
MGIILNINKRREQLIKNDVWVSLFECPKCKNMFSTSFDNFYKYCPYCAEAIEWTDDVEILPVIDAREWVEGEHGN